jgi:hypothetical protein
MAEAYMVTKRVQQFLMFDGRVPESTLSFDLEPLVTFYEDDILPAQIPKHFCLEESR